MFKKLLNFKADIETKLIKKTADKEIDISKTKEKRSTMVAMLQYPNP